MSEIIFRTGKDKHVIDISAFGDDRYCYLWFAKYKNPFLTKHNFKAWYIVTESGYVIDLKRQYVYSPTADKKRKDGNGPTYLYLKLKCSDGRNHKFKVHRLVASAFCPNAKNKKKVHHIDNNKYNNHFSNLLWVRKSEHDTLDRLWKSDKEAYFKMIEEIQNENKGE